VATGETHSVKEFVERAFAAAGVDDWQRHVSTDERFLRPAEVDLLVGDASKARERLGWKPEVDFPALVTRMVAHDLKVQQAKMGR
jgi:GDPmannose 4,6-dehydratase